MNSKNSRGGLPTARTGEILVQSGVITQAQLDIALQEQRARQGSQPLPIAEILVRNRFCTRQQADEAVSRTLTGGSVSGNFHTFLPQSVCRRYSVIPDRLEGDTLIIKSAAPLNDSQKKALIKACLVPIKDIRVRAVSRQALDRESSRIFVDSLVLADALEKLRLEEPTGNLIQNVINALFKEALDVRASDIHLDLRGDLDSWISWRVDGKLQRKYLVPRKVMGPLVVRLKTEAGMDASETRREQDGRIHHQYGGRVMDFRVSTLPIAGGEGLAIRVSDAESIPELRSIFPAQEEFLEMLQAYLAIREKRGGLILLSGQTGSGKTATLGAMAGQLPRERINVVTLEDPIELGLPFSRQFQVNSFLGQNMAQMERTLLRQDPDVIIIGEIRDADSAVTALKLVESGHLVMTTIHAENSIQSLLRLVSMASERSTREWAAFVISQFLKVSINQSLWARPCGTCSERNPDGTISIHHEGCPSCNHGRRGRVLVHDSLFLAPNVNELERHELQRALQEGSAALLRDVQKRQGVKRITRDFIVRLLTKGAILAVDDLRDYEESMKNKNLDELDGESFEDLAFLPVDSAESPEVLGPA